MSSHPRDESRPCENPRVRDDLRSPDESHPRDETNASDESSPASPPTTDPALVRALLREEIEEIRQAELTEATRKLDDLSPAERAVLDDLTHEIVRQIVGPAVVASTDPTTADTVADLFDLAVPADRES